MAALLLIDVSPVPSGTRTMRHETLLSVLVPVYLIVIGALIIVQMPRQETKSLAVQEKTLAKEDNAPVDRKPDDAGQQAEGPTGSLTTDCEKELRRTADLLRFFANRIQMGEETQSIIADMRQQEKKISAACE